MPRTGGTTIPYPYTAEPQPEDTFLVQFLDFPEGVTEGSTLEEAAEYAQEVLDLLVEAYTEASKTLPAASPVGDLPFSVAVTGGCQSRSRKIVQ